jgi:hypothetical protein
MAYTLQIAGFGLAFFLVAWIQGRGLQSLLGTAKEPADRGAAALLSIPAGIGFLALTLFVLAAFDCLTPVYILIVVTLETLLFAYLVYRELSLRGEPPWQSLKKQLASTAWLYALVSLCAVPVFLAALGPPLQWDEVSYHLPYAREYLEAGGLTVAEYLRFPLHSHNYQLLYAAALMFSAEAGAHLIHAFSGALVALGTWYFGRTFFSPLSGVVAALLYLSFAGDMLDTAYVDLGLGLFLFYSFFSFAWWLKGRNDGFLYLSAFLLAIAAGIKYQALPVLPAFAVMLLLATRSPRRLLGFAAIIALFGTWWYIRNLLISGDPFHPFGGRLFGYWIWDSFDLEGVKEHFSRINDPLPAYLWPAMLSILFLRRERAVINATVFYGLFGLAFWWFTTHYERYLIPVFPFLALLSAHTVIEAVKYGLARIRPRRAVAPTGDKTDLRYRFLPALGLVLLVMVMSYRESGDACFSEACIERELTARTATYRLWEEVPGFGGLSLYQHGFEDEIYYLGRPLGDWRGRYRYQAIFNLNKDAALLREYLLQLGRDGILVNRKRAPFYAVLDDPALPEYFETLYENEQLVLLKVRP